MYALRASVCLAFLSFFARRLGSTTTSMADKARKHFMLSLRAHHGLKNREIQAEFSSVLGHIVFTKVSNPEEWKRKQIAWAISEHSLILCNCVFQLFVKIILNAVDTRQKAVKMNGWQQTVRRSADSVKVSGLCKSDDWNVLTGVWTAVWHLQTADCRLHLGLDSVSLVSLNSAQVSLFTVVL